MENTLHYLFISWTFFTPEPPWNTTSCLKRGKTVELVIQAVESRKRAVIWTAISQNTTLGYRNMLKRTLAIHCRKASPGAFQFIAANLSSLKNLTIERLDRSDHGDIILPSLNLQSLNLLLPARTVFRFMTYHDNFTKYYNAGNLESGDIDYSEAISYHYLDVTRRVTDNPHVLNYSDMYKVLNEETINMDINKSFLMLKKEVLDQRISDVAQIFTDSVIKFENIEIQATSGDIFLHNHFSIDDGAYGLGSDEVYQKPTAKIKSSSYMGAKTYYELSIYWSFVKFLVTGGFSSFGGGPVQLLLGSTLGKWKHGEIASTEIFILKDPPEKAFLATRLLNQYHKRDAHRLWGFHRLKSFTGGLTPISPLHPVDHVSQKKTRSKTSTTLH